MSTRRVALSLAALTALATLPVLSGSAPAGASGAVVTPSPSSRGNDDGDPEGPNAQKKNNEPVDNCPNQLWTIPLEIKGLACILLLPKPEPPEGGDGGGGGLGGLLG
jgi:hypothetical protein